MGIQINGQTDTISATPAGAVNINTLGIASKSTTERNAGVSTSVGTIIYNTTTYEVQIYKENTGWVNISNVGDSDTEPLGMTATGGVISDYTDPGPGNVYRAHVFTSSGTFDVTALSSTLPNNVEYLVVAGGGAGGGQGRGGGGGAGGLRTNIPGTPLSIPTSYPVSVATYPVTIGGGGASIPATSTPIAPQTGSFSRFGEPGTNPVWVYASGGGAGGNRGDNTGGSGGSGGGGGSGPSFAPGGSTVTSPDPLSPSVQGSDGGTSIQSAPAYGAGGGGGAGGVGYDGTSSKGGNGGPGIQVLIAGPATTTNVGALNPGPGEYQWFAGGGGGGTYTNDTLGIGGVGGGGTGGDHPNGPESPGFPGTYATGGGGGGGGSTSDGPPGGNGGSGIVVVRYQIGQLTATAKATGGAINYVEGKTVHVFTNSGTFTAPSPLNPTPLSVEYFMVAGGGAGGAADGGGGGGAGGIMTNIPGIIPAPATGGAMAITAGTGYSVSVGSGGAIGGTQNNPGSQGGDGTPSTFNSITAGGGGGGGSAYPSSPNTGRAGLTGGGSGGGGGANPPGSSAGGAGDGHGFSGRAGSPTEPAWQGGGGGGAGEAGQPLGVGGDGLQLPTSYHDPSQSRIGDENPSGPSWGWFAGGGGGGDGDGSNHSDAGVPGGVGGGGRGESATPPSTLYVPATSGSENTGGGGGGKDLHTTADPKAGNGGSGIVIIAYPS